MVKFECDATQFGLLKRLDDGRYINLTDMEFEGSVTDIQTNFMPYTLPEESGINSEYVLLFQPETECPKNFYMPVFVEDLVQYAPSVRKIKQTSIFDFIIAKLMSENNSLHYSVEMEEDGSNAKITLYLIISRDKNTRKDYECVREFQPFVENI